MKDRQHKGERCVLFIAEEGCGLEPSQVLLQVSTVHSSDPGSDHFVL